MYRINNSWYRHVHSDKEKTEIKEFVSGSKAILDELCGVLEREIKDTYKNKSSDYDKCSNWALKQADACGQRSALEKVLRIITLNEKTETTNDSTKD